MPFALTYRLHIQSGPSLEMRIWSDTHTHLTWISSPLACVCGNVILLEVQGEGSKSHSVRNRLDSHWKLTWTSYSNHYLVYRFILKKAFQVEKPRWGSRNWSWVRVLGPFYLCVCPCLSVLCAFLSRTYTCDCVLKSSHQVPGLFAWKCLGVLRSPTLPSPTSPSTVSYRVWKKP